LENNVDINSQFSTDLLIFLTYIRRPWRRIKIDFQTAGMHFLRSFAIHRGGSSSSVVSEWTATTWHQCERAFSDFYRLELLLTVLLLYYNLAEHTPGKRLASPCAN